MTEVDFAPGLRLPGCVSGPRRIILPAFSPWVAGVPWNDHLEPGECLWLVSPARIFPLAKGSERRSVTS